MENPLLKELREGISLLEAQKLEAQKKEVFKGEIVRTFFEAARVLGVCRMSIYRYRQIFGDFPPLPCFRIALKWFKERHGVPKKRGPRRSKQIS